MTDESALWLAQSLQLLLGTVFLVAAITKLRRPSQFVVAVRNYQLIPRALSRPIAFMVVVIELLVAISMLSGWVLDVSVPAATLLLLSFAAAVAINLRRGRVVPCGCFGSVSEGISSRSLGRIGLLFVAVIGLIGVRTASPAGLNVASLTMNGGLELFVSAAAFAALLLMLGTWILHIPELAVVFRLRSNGP
jgi:hypothetical protein